MNSCWSSRSSQNCIQRWKFNYIYRITRCYLDYRHLEMSSIHCFYPKVYFMHRFGTLLGPLNLKTLEMREAMLLYCSRPQLILDSKQIFESKGRRNYAHSWKHSSFFTWMNVKGFTTGHRKQPFEMQQLQTFVPLITCNFSSAPMEKRWLEFFELLWTVHS